jgi:hypothetical protein
MISERKTEADEAAWYTTPEGRRQTEREFARAIRSGSLIRSTGLKTAKTDAKVLEQLMEERSGKA